MRGLGLLVLLHLLSATRCPTTSTTCFAAIVDDPSQQCTYLLSTFSDILECTPLPDVTVVRCSATNVTFAIEWPPGPSTRSINIDTNCKLLNGSYTTGYIIYAFKSESDHASVTNLAPEEDENLPPLFPNVTTGSCMSMVWLPNNIPGKTDPLNETTVECFMPRPTPQPTVVSDEGMYTTAGEISPSNSVSSNKLQDYIPVLIILPILLITLASVMIIAVIVVTAKLKYKQTADAMMHKFACQDRDFQDSKFFNEIEPDIETVFYDSDVQSNLDDNSFKSIQVISKHQPQAQCITRTVSLDETRVQTDYIKTVGNYTTLTMTSPMQTSAQSATDSGVESCYDYQGNHIAAMGSNVSMVDQAVLLHEKNECDINCSAYDISSGGTD